MALKDTWQNRVNGENVVFADDVNQIAQAVIDLEKNGGGGGGGGGVAITIDTEMSDTSRNPVENRVTKAYVDTAVGNIEASLDAIIEIQNSLIGGDGV